MKQKKTTMFLAMMLTLLLGWTSAVKADNVVVVEWFDDGIIINALYDAINADMEDGEYVGPEDRVYQLQAGGFYYNEASLIGDFPLRIVGEEPADGEHPAVIKSVRNEAGDAPGSIIVANDDLELRNLWIVGRTDFGDEEWHAIDLAGAGSTIVIDNIVFEYNFGVTFHALTRDMDISITNSHWRNVIDHSQYWAGRVLRLEAPTKRVVMENNTFLNLGHVVLQVQHPITDYLWFNHNTVVNTGRQVLQYEHVQMQNAYVTNNLMINGFWHGETDEHWSATRLGEEDNQFSTWIDVDYLDPALGLESNRRVLISNNVQWVHPDIYAYYDQYPEEIGRAPSAPPEGQVRAAAFLNERALDVIAMNEEMKWENHLNLTGEDLGLQFQNDGHFDDLAQMMLDWIIAFRAGEETPEYNWEMPGRDTDPGMLSQTVSQIYPIADNAENFSYTHTGALTHAIGDLPAGNLNWFPAEKADWESRKDALANDILSRLAQPMEIEVLTNLEAADASLSGDAEYSIFDGFGYVSYGAGTVRWEFDLEDGGQYDIGLLIKKPQAMTALNLFVNDVEIHDLKGWGEFVFDTDDGIFAGQPIDEWTWAQFGQDGIVEDGALTLNEGSNEFRIETGWANMDVAALRILEPGTDNVVVELSVADAVELTLAPQGLTEKGGDPHPFVPRAFDYIAMADGSASWTVDAEAETDVLMNVFYQSDSGDQSAVISINGVEVETAVLEAPDEEATFYATSFLKLDEGANTIEISSNSGDLNLDYVQVISIISGLPSSADQQIVDGFELRQNYPNPFNPTTQIQYTIPESANVRMEVYNLIGQRVAVLTDGFQHSGTHTLQFDGSHLASGVYIYRLQAGNHVSVRKMTLIK
ncbi:T9SS type A sorting domain-containing protein [Balneolaceae bacterium ANBcel3]|nr:T9SS type A sorting domain-containing protein [Balneolaceae bacterium ANBcel3]